MALPMLVFLTAVAMVTGYPDGPPLDACKHMFPTGHDAEAKKSTPPYTLTASVRGGGSFVKAGDSVDVTLTATGDPDYPYYEGMFVQARKANCQSDPVGKFIIPSEDNFLKLMKCSDTAGSAVSHKVATHQTNKTFTWIAPNDFSYRIYFVATVVKNEKNFWTNVRSDYLTYDGDNTPEPSQHCVIRKPTSFCPELKAPFVTVLLMIFFSLLCRP